jgi:hypothetical protein
MNWQAVVVEENPIGIRGTYGLYCIKKKVLNVSICCMCGWAFMDSRLRGDNF